MKIVAVLCLVGMLGGCGVQLPSNIKGDLSNAAALAKQTYTSWETLTPVQQKTAFGGATLAIENLNNAATNSPAQTQP